MSQYAQGWEDACLILARLLDDAASDYRSPGGGAPALFKAATACRELALRPHEVMAVFKPEDNQ